MLSGQRVRPGPQRPHRSRRPPVRTTLLRCRLLLLLAAALGAAAMPAPGLGEDKPDVGKKGDKKAEKSRHYALVVGIRNYKKGELRPLKYADKDAAALADLLRRAGYRRVVLMTYEAAADDAD